MKAAVCTLFEHHYHFGAAVLVNSLCAAGFRGTVYAGFRGPLPAWAADSAQPAGERRWDMTVTPDVRLVFLGLETPAHFTNYKPDFMLQLEALDAGATEALVYCDPDIVFNGAWRHVEEWLTCGLAVCEDVNSPLRDNHPRRVGWQRFFAPHGHELKFRTEGYANGGFLGLPWRYRAFLLTWQKLLRHVTDSLGGADVVGIGGGRMLEGNYGFADCFHQPDQDALNAALEASPEIPISFLGPAAMAFAGGDAIVPHALGVAKPWRRRYLREALGGRPPRLVDKIFWQHARGVLRPYEAGEIDRQQRNVAIGSAMGRFMRRL